MVLFHVAKFCLVQCNLYLTICSQCLYIYIFFFCSLTLHPDKLLVATGQIGKAPYICVWDSNSTDTVSILKDGHQNGVGAVGFDRGGTVSGKIYIYIYIYANSENSITLK